MNFQLIPSGDTAIVVEFGDRIDRDINHDVLKSATILNKSVVEGIVEIVPTIRSLIVHYDPLKVTSQVLSDQMVPLLDKGDTNEIQARLWHLPVCYEQEYAPDLEDVARSTGLTTSDVITLHSNHPYHIYMIGFLPGFPYMGDLPEKLRLSRRDSPRISVPKGSVAIANTMTAIYPIESPGGWHLIGTTPVCLFDNSATSPALFTAGDQVLFKAVNKSDLQAIEVEIASGTFTLFSELIRSSSIPR